MTHHPPQPVHISHHDDRLVVNVPENLYFPEVATSLGGLRDPDSRVWHFPSRSEPLLRQHGIRLFGATRTCHAPEIQTLLDSSLRQ